MLAGMRAQLEPRDLDLHDAPAWVRVARWSWEGVLLVLALLAVGLLATESTPLTERIQLLIWLVFVADYVARLAAAEQRVAFVRGNVLDLVAILPLDFFRAARAVKVVRVFRAAALLWRVTRAVRDVLRTNGLWLLVLVAVVLVLGGGLAAAAVEPGIANAADGVWWAVVTTTTVGYGDISPTTLPGRLIAAVLMFTGIGLIGSMTGSVATYVLRGGAEPTCADPDVRHLRERLADWDRLSPEERARLAALLSMLADPGYVAAPAGRRRTSASGQ